MWLHLSFLYEISRHAAENWVHLLIFLHFYPVLPKSYLPSLTTGLLSTRRCDPCSLSSEHCPSVGCKCRLHKLCQWNTTWLYCSAGSAVVPGHPTAFLQQKEWNSFHLFPCNSKWFPSCPSLSWWRHRPAWTEMSKFYVPLSQSKAVSPHELIHGSRADPSEQGLFLKTHHEAPITAQVVWLTATPGTKSSWASIGLPTRLITSFLPKLFPSLISSSSDTAAALSRSSPGPVPLTRVQSASEHPQSSPTLCPAQPNLTDRRLLHMGWSPLAQSHRSTTCSLCLAILADFQPMQ